MKNLILSVLITAFSFSAFSVTKSRYEELELFNKVLYLIESQYYRKVDTKKLVEGALKGMMDTLDPHSAFLNKDYFKKMQNDTNGEFGGLGIEVTQKDGMIYVVTPIDDTPAYRAGIKSRDKIVEINHDSILGLTLDEAIDKMKGKKGSKIHLGVVRDGEKGLKHFTMKRETIKVNSVKSYLLENNYAFIRLTQFQRRSSQSILNALVKLESKSKKKGGLKGIILDLRSNPGGLLDQAVKISSHFLKKGIVVSTESRDPNNKDIHYVKKSGKKFLTHPLVVLVNGASASASEIVAGALQDNKRAIIMGSQTFGKGSVQTVAQIDKHNGVKLTIAQYMTPSGKKIQAIGIKPDVNVSSLDQDIVEESQNRESYIREKDLKNHLTATIETKEEKKSRIADEKKERAARLKKLNAKKEKKKGSLFKKYDPKSDYQALQAINYIKAISRFKKLK